VEGRKETKKEGRKDIRRIKKLHIWESTDTLDRSDCWTSHMKLETVKRNLLHK
jgi:hypothetical protein